MAEPIIVDYANTVAKDAACAKTEEVHPCADYVALVLAYGTNTTPVEVAFDDPDVEAYTCKSPDEAPIPRPLQMYENTTLVARAVQCARAAGSAAVFVLAPASIKSTEAQTPETTTAARIAEEARAAGADGAVFFDAHAAEKARVASNNFELFGVSRYVLDVAAACLAQVPTACNALIMSCEQARIEPRHLQQLSFRLHARPQTDIVASWISWLRRLPLAVRGSWLMEDANLVQPRYGIGHLRVNDVVFGEEKLATNQSWPPAFETFFASCKLSALEAVRLAKQVRAAQQAGDPTQVDTLMANINDAESQLIGLAAKTLEELARATSAAATATGAGTGAASAATSAPAEPTTPTLEARVAAADAWGTRRKQDFPLFADPKHRDTLAYLDSAATAQRLGSAEEAMMRFDLHENANVYRGAYDLSMQATRTLDDARAELERFIGARRRETIYTQNTTGGCALVAQAWGESNIHAGDCIALCEADHHSNMLPWIMLAERAGARVAFVPLENTGHIDTAAYAKALALHPKIVCIPHITNVIGIVNPIAEMAAAAHAAGARVFVDGAQSLPHVKIDVRDLGADFFAFSGHKAYGPAGIGGVWVHPDAYAEMQPLVCGGGTVGHVSTDSYCLRPGSVAYELGTPAVGAAVGLASAVAYLEELGMDAVAEHSRALSEYLVAGLRSINGVTVYGRRESADELTGLVSLNVHGMAPAEIATVLGKLDVCIRSGGHCALPIAATMGIIGSARISFGVYNTREDVEAALTALRLCRVIASAS